MHSDNDLTFGDGVAFWALLIYGPMDLEGIFKTVYFTLPVFGDLIL